MKEDALSRREFIRGATAGAAAVGATGTAAAQTETETGTPMGTEAGTETSGGSGGGGGGGGGGPTKEVIVGPDGSLVYDPVSLEITPGTTVKFIWESDNHNIVVENQPEGANWEGTAGSDTTTYDTGHEYSYTFETLGTYDYYCQPHLTAGMEAEINVVETLSTPESSGPAVPDSAKTLGVATTFAMLATLTLAFFFLKYGGGERPGNNE